MSIPDREALLRLPLTERLDLAICLWDSIAEEQANFPVDPAVVAEMERRIDEYERHPERGRDWGEVASEIEQRIDSKNTQ